MSYVPFQSVFISCGEILHNLALFMDKNGVVLNHKKFPGISAIDIKQSSFSSKTFKIMSLYRSPSSSVSTCYNTLQNVITLAKKLIVFLHQIVGDFNINVLNSTVENIYIYSSAVTFTLENIC